MNKICQPWCNKRFIISSKILLALPLLFFFFTSSAGGTAIITFDKSIGIPARNFNVTYGGNNFSIAIADIGNYKIGDNIGVTVTGGVNNMRLVLFTVDKITPWFQSFPGSSGYISTIIPAGKFDPNCPDVCGSGPYTMGPGSYALAVQNIDNSQYFIAKPLIVSVYDMAVTPDITQVNAGGTIKVTVTVSENGIPVNVAPNNVNVGFVQDSTNNHFNGTAQATSSTGVYQANIPVPSSASGSYRLYTAITTNRTIYQNYPEIIGAASYSETVTFSSSSSGTGSGGGGSGSAGGGGGGGGITSGEPFENILKKETREELLAKDTPAKYTFTTPDLPVSEIQITSSTNAGIISAQVELLKNVSKLVNENPPGVVYKYVNIWVGTSGFAVPKNIKEAIIKFKVENSWLRSGNIKDTDAVMLRWDGLQWNALDTQVTGKDENFTYYQAKTNAFSPFAISSAEVLLATPVPTATAIPPTETTTSTPIATKAPGFEVVLVVAVLSTLYILRGKRR